MKELSKAVPTFLNSSLLTFHENVMFLNNCLNSITEKTKGSGGGGGGLFDDEEEEDDIFSGSKPKIEKDGNTIVNKDPCANNLL